MIKQFFLALFCLILPALTNAAQYGANFYYIAYGLEPDGLYGYQIMLSYYPDFPTWRQFSIYFDGGFSQWMTKDTPYYSTLSMYSIAPVLRFTFQPRGIFRPYLEASVGLTYLNHTRFDSRNLGIHFAFQDRLGMGTYIGCAERFSVGLHAEHYSNAHLSSHNSGVTAPLVLDVGYRF